MALFVRPSLYSVAVVSPLFAHHWSTGQEGLTVGMMLLVAVPYVLAGLGAVFVRNHLRRQNSRK